MDRLRLLLVLLFVSIIVNSFAQIDIGDNGASSTVVTSTLISGTKDGNMEGSRYLFDFVLAKLKDRNGDFLIRYNALKDIMEYKNGNSVVELAKHANKYFVFENGPVYELMSIATKKGTVEQYHQILVDTNQVKVSKFSSVKLIEAVAAKNNYDRSTPAYYKTNKDQYYITYEGKTLPFDGKQKALESTFPQHVTLIREFYKKYKVSESDDSMKSLAHLFVSF